MTPCRYLVGNSCDHQRYSALSPSGIAAPSVRSIAISGLVLSPYFDAYGGLTRSPQFIPHSGSRSIRIRKTTHPGLRRACLDRAERRQSPVHQGDGWCRSPPQSPTCNDRRPIAGNIRAGRRCV